MKSIKLFFMLLFVLFLIPLGYSLECSYDAKIEKVEFSLDDPFFSKKFDGDSGIITTFTYNKSTGDYTLWQTSNLAKRTDKGEVIDVRRDKVPINLDSSSKDINEKMLRIDTSSYNKMYKKLYLKNIGSCGINVGSSNWHSKMKQVGGTSLNTGSSSFFQRIRFDLEPNEIKTKIVSEEISGFYSGIMQVGDYIRVEEVYQIITTNFWFDGPSGFNHPDVKSMNSRFQRDIETGDNYNFNVELENPDNEKEKLDYRFVVYDYNYPNRYRVSNNIVHDFRGEVEFNPKETKTINYPYDVPGESDFELINSYFSCYDLWYYDDVFEQRFRITHSCSWIGSPDNPYLLPQVDTGRTLGTTGEGLPSLNTEIDYREYNRFNAQDIPANRFEKEITVKRKKEGSWSDFETYTNTISQEIPANDVITEDFSHIIYNFTDWEDTKANIYIKTKDSSRDLFQYRDPSFSSRFRKDPIDVDLSHLLVSTDLPTYFYSNGDITSKTIRDVLFNLRDYSLNNVSVNISVINPNTNSVSSKFDLSYNSNFDVPAQSSFPIPIHINYTGGSENNRYLISLNYSYYDEIVDENNSKVIFGNIYTRDDTISSNYYDVLPTKIEYDSLYRNRDDDITVKLDSQGNEDIPSSYKVSLSYRNFSSNDFTLIDEKTVSRNADSVTFPYTPSNTGRIVLKSEVDTQDSIDETSSSSNLHGETNNELASIGLVRDIDMELDFAKPLYDEVENDGVIPFKLGVHNNGVGGIDAFDVILNISKGTEENWIFKKTYNNIPREGRNFTYSWNVTNLPPAVYSYTARVEPEFDKNWNNNELEGILSFCNTPWHGNPKSCFSSCNSNCLDSTDNRYRATCHLINSCEFHNSSFAESCDGYKDGTYVSYNETHVAKCPDATIIVPPRFTNTTLEIEGETCDEIHINEKPVTIHNKQGLMNIVSCIK